MKKVAKNHMALLKRESRCGSAFARRVLAPSAILALFVVLLTIPWGSPTIAQIGPQNSRLQADRFVDRVIDGEPVSCMYGNVFIDRDTITVAADTVYAFRDRDAYEFVGHVRVTRSEVVVTSERGDYERLFGNGNFYGNVRIIEGELIGTGDIAESRDDGRLLRLIGDALLVTPDYSVRADTIVQDRLTGHGEAFGRVSIIEPGATNLVTGEHATFEADGEVAVVDRSPVLTSREQGSDPLHSVAGRMLFYRSEERVVMIDSVRIRQGLTVAEADTAVAYGKNRMVLTGAPNVSLGGASTIFGDRIDFRYRDGELRRLIITGTARMEDSSPDSLARLYQGLPDMDVLEGDSITVDFEEGTIRRSVVVGNAHSRYTPLDLNDEVATNDATGDTITIHFKRQRVARVRIQGNAQGEYRFARLAAMNAMLGKSRRLADMLARDNADSSAVADSLIAQVDSLAGTLGLTLPDLTAQVADSLLSAAMDSLAAAGFDTSQSSLDFHANAQNVKYAGDQVTFEMSDRSMEIEKNGVLDYGTLHMTAEHIKLDTDSRELYAEGNPIVEDSDTIVGTKMGYNFEHKSASVVDGVTAFDEYYFVGDNIRRFGDQTMKICGGRMSSCDLEIPHYNFWSGKMKMRPKDKVVAAPIILRIGEVPVFALPFYYKNMKEGRQSGILFPSFDFGWSSREGRYIRDFGYYWATNDFMDFVIEGDYNERREFGYRISNRYVKRYGFNGGIDYSRKIGLGDNNVDEWQLRWNHNQPILWDDYKFRADVKMASTTLTSNDFNGSNGRDIVSGQLKSSAYLSRNWSFGNISLSANRDERVNASDDDPASDNLISSMTLPSMTMNFKQLTLAPSLRAGETGSMIGNIFRSTYFQQGYSLKSDSQSFENREEATQVASGNWSLSYRPARLGIFNVSLTTSARQTWTRDTTTGQLWNPDTNFVGGGFYTDFDESTEKTQPGLNLSTGVGTTLYGLFPLQVGRLKALRHTARFNTSWNLTPGLGSKQLHNTSIGLSMDNRVDVKYLGAGSDSTITEKKLDGVINWSLRTSFSPKAAANAQWSDVTSGLTIKPGQSRYLKLQVNNSIDPYNFALKNTRFTYQLSFSGRLDVGEVPEYTADQRNQAIDRLGVDFAQDKADSTKVDDYAAEFADNDIYDDQGDGDYFEGEANSFNDLYKREDRNPRDSSRDLTEGGRYIPFDVSGSFSYSYTNLSKDKRATANMTFNTQLTRNWEFRYTASFDLETGQTTRQQYSLNRDLHCWRFEFNRIISNVDSQFGFRIYLRSIPALKFARGREDYMGSPGAGMGGGIF